MSRFLNRFTFAAGLLLISGGLIFWAFRIDRASGAFDLLINLGTEVFGILLVLAVVDWMLERRRLQDRARDLAWSVLHQVERAVWVWQGGPRRLEGDELLGIIRGIDLDHELSESTRTLLIAVGEDCREALARSARSIKTLPGLQEALRELTTLSSLSEQRSTVSIRMVQEVLGSGVRRLHTILGHANHAMPSKLIRGRDARVDAQAERVGLSLRSLPPAGLRSAPDRGRGAPSRPRHPAGE